jgi:hypothetical protein
MRFIVATQVSAQEVSSLREALAQDPAAPEVLVNTLPSTEATFVKANKPTVNSVATKQAYIWVSIILAVVLFFSVMALLNMDSGAEKDTILYAKFLRVDDGR